jgi:radical SAM superfamily enzyme YgiQ (UPF0313 family)
LRLVLASSPARESPEALPLGVASVAAALGARPELSSLGLAFARGLPGEGGSALAERIAGAEPDAVGLSVYSWNRAAMAEAAEILRARWPELLLFAGGPEATADPEALVLETGLDFAVAGEGEAATAAAMRALLEAGFPARRPWGAAPGSGARADALAAALGGIPGIVLPGSPWRLDTPADPASLASPWLRGTLDPRDCGGDVLWELSRGCPFRCSYCYESKGASGSRPFPAERIEAELELFVRAGVRYAFVLDPTFDSEPRRAAALLDLFRERAPAMRWKFEVRAELLDKALVRRFAALDCSLQIGLQSARAETLALVGRPGFDRRDFARRAAMLGSAGVSFGLDLIAGLPGDGLRDFEESLDFAIGLEPNHLDLFPLALLPGTELFDRSVELGIEADPRPPYLVRSTREMPAAALESALSLAAACDRFYTAGRAVGWFRAALKPLKARPSAFLRDYGAWLAGKGADARRASARSEPAREIEEEQLGFASEAYAAAGLGALVPALRDLVRLHGAWGRALAEGEESELDLSYDPEELLGAAAAGLAAFVRSAKPLRAAWRVIPDEDEGARIAPSRGPRQRG